MTLINTMRESSDAVDCIVPECILSIQMSNVTFEMPVSRVNQRALFADGPVSDLFHAAAKGTTKAAVLKMANDAAGNRGEIVSLEHFLQPLCRLSRPTGKRGFRWDVMIDGKLVNAKTAYSISAFNELPPTAKVVIARVRPVTNDQYADSRGFNSIKELMAQTKATVDEPTPKPASKPKKTKATPKTDDAPLTEQPTIEAPPIA